MGEVFVNITKISVKYYVLSHYISHKWFRNAERRPLLRPPWFKIIIPLPFLLPSIFFPSVCLFGLVLIICFLSALLTLCRLV